MEDKIEPFGLHVLHFVDITSASFNVQKMISNIMLERKVENKWNLPFNCRIVVSENKLDDSLETDKKTDYLFSFCAHINVCSTSSKYLQQLDNTDVHPVIYSYIAYKLEHGTKEEIESILNSDPRKWKLASKMLIKTNNPLTLITFLKEKMLNEFCIFCSCRVITLDQVLYSNYLPEYDLTKEEQYATLVNLSQVDEENVEIVRRFVRDNLGGDLVKVFDLMWAKGNEDRLRLLEEINQKEQVKKRVLK